MALRGIHHVQVNVPDVGAALDFYGSLGMTVREDRPDFGVAGAWLDAAGQQIHLVEAAAAADLGQHFALEIDGLDGFLDGLRARGVEVREPRSLGPGLPRQTVVHDPAGNRIELREPAAG